jgi:hypothetical protein
MKRIAIFLVSALAIGLVACQKDESLDAIDPAGSPSAPATDPETLPAAVPDESAPVAENSAGTEAEAEPDQPSATDVPIAEDFADDAEQRIGEQNLEQELSRIETELGNSEMTE